MWRCDNTTPEANKCAKVCYRRETFHEHLRKAYRLDNKAITVKTELCRMGRNAQSRVWCGFCTKLIDLTARGVNAWPERFNHIDNHFMGCRGLAPQRIQDWYPVGSAIPKQNRLRWYRNKCKFAMSWRQKWWISIPRTYFVPSPFMSPLSRLALRLLEIASLALECASWHLTVRLKVLDKGTLKFVNIGYHTLCRTPLTCSPTRDAGSSEGFSFQGLFFKGFFFEGFSFEGSSTSWPSTSGCFLN